MIRFLAISFGIFFLFSSCSLRTTEGLRQVPHVDSEITNPYFANSNLDYVYKAKIEVYTRNFGGILIIKKTDANTHRIVMTTEFGGKLMDLEYDGHTFTKNFVIDELDRKFILEVLKEDFRMLLIEKTKPIATYISPEAQVYKASNGNRFDFYFFGSTSGFLDKIVKTSKSKEKVTVNFSSLDGQVAEKIAIHHNNIQLKIDLEKFKEEKNAN